MTSFVLVDADSSAGPKTSSVHDFDQHDIYEIRQRAAHSLEVESDSPKPIKCACEKVNGNAGRYPKYYIHQDTEHKGEAPSASSCQTIVAGQMFGDTQQCNDGQHHGELGTQRPNTSYETLANDDVGSPGSFTSENAAVTFGPWYDITANITQLGLDGIVPIERYMQTSENAAVTFGPWYDITANINQLGLDGIVPIERYMQTLGN